MEQTKLIAVTKEEAELIMDSFRVSNLATRDLALKASGIVLEFAASEYLSQAERLADQAADKYARNGIITASLQENSGRLRPSDQAAR